MNTTIGEVASKKMSNEEAKEFENSVVIVPLPVFALAITYMKHRPYSEVSGIIDILERSNVVDISEIENKLYGIAFENIKRKASDMAETLKPLESDICESFVSEPLVSEPLVSEPLVSESNEIEASEYCNACSDMTDGSKLASEDEVMNN